MYRPNRIGPWMLAHLDQAPFNFGTLPSGSQTLDKFRPFCPDTTIRTTTASRSFYGNSEATMAERTAQSVGVAINGEHPAGEDLAAAGDRGFMLTVAGSLLVSGQDAAEQTSCQVLIGRCNTATLFDPTVQHNDCPNWIAIPSQYAANNDGMVCTVNTAVIFGNWDGGITVSDNPIIAAFRFANTGQATAQYEFSGSMCVHKYSQDLHVFDPTRQ